VSSTNGTYRLFSVIHLFRNGKRCHDADHIINIEPISPLCLQNMFSRIKHCFGHLIDVRLRFMASENSKPRKQARLDTFLIPRRDEKSQR
jgi:hypothetical protein